MYRNGRGLTTGKFNTREELEENVRILFKHKKIGIVAKKCGVSVSTVDLIMKDKHKKTKEEIKKIGRSGRSSEEIKYINSVNNFIPAAEEIADDEVRRFDFIDPESYGLAWNAVFHREMIIMTKEAGIRNLGHNETKEGTEAKPKHSKAL